jgi:hypothetical protein
MRKHNGKQLYGIQKILTTLKMGMNVLLMIKKDCLSFIKGWAFR